MAANNIDRLVAAMQTLVTAMGAPPAAPQEALVVKIEPFYGDKQGPITWIEEFEKAATANNYTNDRKLQIVQAHLKGTAAIWLYERQQVNATNPTS